MLIMTITTTIMTAITTTKIMTTMTITTTTMTTTTMSTMTEYCQRNNRMHEMVPVELLQC